MTPKAFALLGAALLIRAAFPALAATEPSRIPGWPKDLVDIAASGSLARPLTANEFAIPAVSESLSDSTPWR